MLITFDPPGDRTWAAGFVIKHDHVAIKASWYNTAVEVLIYLHLQSEMQIQDLLTLSKTTVCAQIRSDKTSLDVNENC